MRCGGMTALSFLRSVQWDLVLVGTAGATLLLLWLAR
jgi:hypothetical protein